MDDAALLRSIPAIKASLGGMTREQLVRVWQNTVEAQGRTQDAAFWSATEQLLDAVDAAFAAPERRGQKDFLDEGPLGLLGYHVGRRAGLSAAQRQALLSAIYRRPIPQLFPPHYLAEWGDPQTPQRLQRMIRAIDGFMRDPKRRNDPRLDDAMAEWQEDLDYLRREYHSGTFSWPAI